MFAISVISFFKQYQYAVSHAVSLYNVFINYTKQTQLISYPFDLEFSAPIKHAELKFNSVKIQCPHTMSLYSVHNEILAKCLRQGTAV